MTNKKLLVVSAHAADYVWRSGGTIAKYIEAGAEVHVVCLSFGIRGESNDLWKTPGRSYEDVKEIRRGETTAAAKILGIQHFELWDQQDYPIRVTEELEDRLVRKIREVRPDIIITHDRFDIMNPDHNDVSAFVYRCAVMSNSNGVRIEGTTATKQMKIFGFEPHQTELSNYKPGSIVDITSVYDKKVAAMECFKAQSHLIEYYKQRAFMRGNHARRLSGDQSYKYAESFMNYYPAVGPELY